MIPVRIVGKAIAGEVSNTDPDRRERIGKCNRLRPSITLRTKEICPMPIGTEVWWTRASSQREWVVVDVAPVSGGSDVTLVLQTHNFPDVGLPQVGQQVCFSQLNTKPGFELRLPTQAPWTHVPAVPPAPPSDLESTNSEVAAA
jgi:hypothetical protein